MKCVIKKAKQYQQGFKAGLIFTGFEDGKIQWLGTDNEFNTFELLKENNGD